MTYLVKQRTSMCNELFREIRRKTGFLWCAETFQKCVKQMRFK
jgi:hypothetical protein